MTDRIPEDTLPEKEAEHRAREVARRMLTTPKKPASPSLEAGMPKKKLRRKFNRTLLSR